MKDRRRGRSLSRSPIPSERDPGLSNGASAVRSRTPSPPPHVAMPVPAGSGSSAARAVSPAPAAHPPLPHVKVAVPSSFGSLTASGQRVVSPVPAAMLSQPPLPRTAVGSGPHVASGHRAVSPAPAVMRSSSPKPKVAVTAPTVALPSNVFSWFDDTERDSRVPTPPDAAFMQFATRDTRVLSRPVSPKKDAFSEWNARLPVHAERIEQSCTFLQTGKKFTQQVWYKCLTCHPDSALNWGLCESCKSVCHRGHQLQQQGPSSFYCDCGSEKSSRCKINGRSHRNTNQREREDEDEEEEEEEVEDDDEDEQDDDDEDDDDEDDEDDEDEDQDDDDRTGGYTVQELEHEFRRVEQYTVLDCKETAQNAHADPHATYYELKKNSHVNQAEGRDHMYAIVV
jgi:hypothetical protein